MSVAADREPADEGSMFAECVIDGCVNHGWADQREITAYMSAGWREYLGSPGLLPNGGGMIPIAPSMAYQYPAEPGRAPAQSERRIATDPAALCATLLDGNRIDHAVLGFDHAALATALINPYVSQQITRAMNRWTTDRWLATDRRLSSMMLVSMQVPTGAADEIRRTGRDPRIVGVFLGGNGLGKAFGHPCYHVVYQAAVEMGLPVVIKSNSEAVIDSPATVSGVGDPATYAEFRIMESHPLMTHVTSMITQGVFENFPSLKVLVVGGGLLWVPALLWRLDDKYKGLHREVPWVRRLPSEYFRQHVRVGTYPFDQAPTPRQLRKALALVDHLDEIACFTGGFPHWDADQAEAVARDLPDSAVRGVMGQNAAHFFRGLGSVLTERHRSRSAQAPRAVS